MGPSLRHDICVGCGKEITLDGSVKTLIGPKTKVWEWYLCAQCQKTVDMAKVLVKVEEEDELFFEEDQEEATKN